jgi:hypothetical protein
MQRRCAQHNAVANGNVACVIVRWLTWILTVALRHSKVEYAHATQDLQKAQRRPTDKIEGVPEQIEFGFEVPRYEVGGYRSYTYLPQ